MTNEGNLSALLPLLVFMGFMVAIGFWVRRQNAGKNFVQTYFIGNHDLGGFVLAMTTVATYSSVSSFVGGPGMAWQIGFGWVYMAVVQVTAIFLVLGIFGKRVAMLSRRFDAVTVVDIIRERFQSDGLATLAAFIIVLFFCGTMTAQFVGGAKLFATVTGYSYEMGLLLFGLVVVLYTSIGGFRAVAITDTCCAIMMMIGIALLLYYVLEAGGGLPRTTDCGSAIVRPHAGRTLPDAVDPRRHLHDRAAAVGRARHQLQGHEEPAQGYAHRHGRRWLHEHRRQLHGHPRARRADGAA